MGSDGGPSRELTWREAERWLAGRELFAREHQEADGLGAPGFNAQSCAFCHKEPATGGAGGPEVDVVLPRGARGYGARGGAGNQLARMHQLREHLATLGEHGAPIVAATLDVRQTPSLLGLGLLDTIPDEEILRNEDAQDVNRDGVRGVASRVEVNGTREIGRFGWKAEVPRLADFTCRALGGELGLTAPDQGRGFGLAADDDGTADPETTQEALDDLAFFVAHLAAPKRGEASAIADVQRGELLFERLGCAACHVPILHGTDGPVPLYSDLLLHEIRKPPTADSAVGRSSRKGRIERPREQVQVPEVAESLFRTAPLWGVGKTAPYLHDGSAKTLHEAVLAHDAEAAAAREGFEALGSLDQQALVAFLASL